MSGGENENVRKEITEGREHVGQSCKGEIRTQNSIEDGGSTFLITLLEMQM